VNGPNCYDTSPTGCPTVSSHDTNKNHKLALDTSTQHTYLSRRSTSSSRIFLEKLRVPLFVKESPPFYGNRRFITLFTKAREAKIPASAYSINTPIPTLISYIQIQKALSSFQLLGVKF
jgi:hypothetical protein